MATSGNLKILGGDEDYEETSFTFTGEEGQQILFFFNREINEYRDSKKVNINWKDKPPEVKVVMKDSNRKDYDTILQQLKEKLHKLKCFTLDDIGMTEVRRLLKRENLQTALLPLETKEKAINVYGFEEDIKKFKRLLKDNDKVTENISYKETINRSKEHVQSTKDTILEFDTNEGLKVKVYKEAITKVKVDAIVNAANNSLANIGGVALVISKAAGTEMERECKEKINKHNKIPDGDNVVTGAGRLPFNHVIHAVGPRWSSYPDKSKCLHVLKETVVNILKASKYHGIQSVAMPPISSGIFGVPKKLCAAMYVSAIVHFSMNESPFYSLKEFHIIDINEDLLYMIKDWYEKWRVNHVCLKISSILTKTYDPINHQEKLQYPGHNLTNQQQKLQYPGHNLTNQQQKLHYPGHNDKDASKDSAYGHQQQKPGKGSFKEHNKHSSISETSKQICQTNVHFYTRNILDLKDINIIVVSEDPFFKGEGALAKTLLENGGDCYRKDHAKIQKELSKSKYPYSNIVMTKAGKKHPFQHVFHVVIDRMPSANDPYYIMKFTRTINDVLSRVDGLGHEKKKKVGDISLALPMIGAGGLTDISFIETYCNALSQEILNYIQKHKSTTKIRDIFLVNKDNTFIQILRRAFDEEHSADRGYMTVSFSTPKDLNAQSQKLKLLDTWRRDKIFNEDMSFDKYFTAVGGEQGGDRTSKGNLKILGDDEDEIEELDDCTICLSVMTYPVRLKECQHTFCKECITEFFKQKTSCPVCGTVYGKIYGDQPEEGIAQVFYDPSVLPGFEGKATYVIVYDFPDGKQESNHPDPGTPYKGIKRRAYLPDTEEGKRILGLLKQAFQQGMIFTIGSSRTSGKEGVLTWNDIHHKTSRTGGPQKYGYPDPEYLERVKEELACKGIL